MLTGRYGVALVVVLGATVVLRGSHTSAQPVVSPGVSAYQPKEIEIGLDRMRCFGACPVYRVRVGGDGRVWYEGIEHVATTGTRETRIEMAQVAELVNAFLRVRFFDLLDEYRGRETVLLRDGEYVWRGQGVGDVPAATVSLRLGAREKRVHLHDSYPVELGDLPSQIDIAVNTMQWTGRPTPAHKAPGA